MESFFSKIIQNLIVNYLGLAICKSNDLSFVASNRYTAKLAGFNKPENMIGKNDYDIKCGAVKYAAKFQSQDIKAMENKNISTYLDINHYTNGTRIIIVKRKVLQDSNGKVLGILCHGDDVTCNEQIIYLKKAGVLNNSVLRKQTHSLELVDCLDSRLDETENKCLFYLLHDRTLSDITKFMRLSRCDLHKHVESIKTIMGCNNVAQVIEKSILLGYRDMLPKEIVKNGLMSFS
jgi:hypothetical protein